MRYHFSVTARSAPPLDDSKDHYLVLSVTARSAAIHGDSRDHFLLFCVTTRSAAPDGGNRDHFLIFLSPRGLMHYMETAGTIFWSFCHREVSCRDHFLVFSVIARSGALHGDSRDHFLVFLSPRGLQHHTVIAGTILWSFLSPRGLMHHMVTAGTIFWCLRLCKVCNTAWWQQGPFYGLSVTARSAAPHGDSRDHSILVFCVITRSATPDGGKRDQFLVFLLPRGLPHHMVTAGTNIWSFLSPRGLPHHMVTAGTILWSFCHREVCSTTR